MISSICSEYPALTVKGAYKTATVFYLQRQRTSATNSRLDRSFEVFPVKPNRTSNPLKKRKEKNTVLSIATTPAAVLHAKYDGAEFTRSPSPALPSSLATWHPRWQIGSSGLQKIRLKNAAGAADLCR